MDERRMSGRWGRLKLLGGVVLVAFAVTLAAIVGNRLSDEALGVLAGAVCGVGAAIPTSLLIVAVTRRRESERISVAAPQPQQPAPPQVVVIPPSGGYQGGGWQSWGPTLMPPQQRTFTVVGGDPTKDGEVKDERYF